MVRHVPPWPKCKQSANTLIGGIDLPSVKSINELRAATDEQLISEHDEAARNTVIGTGYYLDELNRRETAKQTKVMVVLTGVITVLTVVNTAAVIVALATAQGESGGRLAGAWIGSRSTAPPRESPGAATLASGSGLTRLCQASEEGWTLPDGSSAVRTVSVSEVFEAECGHAASEWERHNRCRRVGRCPVALRAPSTAGGSPRLLP